MTRIHSILIALSMLSLSSYSFAQQSEEAAVLAFSKTEGFRHNSIAQGNRALMALGTANNFRVDTTSNASLFTSENLKNYEAVVFLNTSGDVLNENQQEAFKNYIQTGGGFVGVHAASNTEYDWPWYGKLVGAYFTNHPKVQEAVLEVVNHNHPSTAHLPTEWKKIDEWYNFRNLNTNVTLLISVNEDTYEGGENGNPHPIAWYHEYDGGRVFYTALGHTKESYSEPMFLEHLLGGILYAIGRD